MVAPQQALLEIAVGRALKDLPSGLAVEGFRQAFGEEYGNIGTFLGWATEPGMRNGEVTLVLPVDYADGMTENTDLDTTILYSNEESLVHQLNFNPDQLVVARQERYVQRRVFPLLRRRDV